MLYFLHQQDHFSVYFFCFCFHLSLYILQGCFGDESVGMQSKQVSLKDLCPEDKERVANLIRELAKAGEEKEATENKLNNERKQFVLKVI